MPHKDPDKHRQASREAMRRKRQGGSVEQIAETLKNRSDLPEPPSREDILKVLGVQAMNGHVTAARTLLEEYRRDGDNVTSDKSTLAVVHDIAARRTKSG
jgi:hypothetical protein